jgi:predicted TIM-barrel fold metal-dependent hydrolase
MVDHTRLLYGSDYPYTPLDSTEALAQELEDGLGAVWPDEREREAVLSENARKLFDDDHL